MTAERDSLILIPLNPPSQILPLAAVVVVDDETAKTKAT